MAHDDVDNNDDRPSKSQIKRDMLDLQKLGESLIKLSAYQLSKIDLPPDLLEAIQFAHTLKTHEAIRRHLQYIGKLMREIDAAEIRAALDKIKMNLEVNTRQFHDIEDWREKLMAGEDSVLTSFVDQFPQADRQVLRHLIRQAKQDREHGKKTGSETKLFQLLRQILQTTNK